jgi:GNAT superfamily N-acetyltransferase
MAENKAGSTEITIRAMRPEDTDRVADLCAQLGYPSTPEEVSRRLSEIGGNDRHVLYVAALPSGGVVGWIHLYMCDIMVDDMRVEIWGLVVDEAHRGAGIGRILMDKAEEWARNNGCRAVYLRSNIIRDRAHRFYEALGYERVKTQHVFRKGLSSQEPQAKHDSNSDS